MEKSRKKAPEQPSALIDQFTHLASTILGTPCIPEYRFHPVRRWRFDYAFPEYKVALEVEGGIWVKGRHINPAGFTKDMEKYNTASSMGWAVVRCEPRKLYTQETIDLLRDAINFRKAQLSARAATGK